jgi:parvulin-like peptidyl-prolyl isomerase
MKHTWMILLFLCSCNRDYMSLAKVNGDSISIGDFKQRLSEIQFDSRLVAEEDVLFLKKTILNEMIEEKLIQQESKKANITVTKEELEQAVQIEHLDEVLEKQKIKKEDWIKRMHQKILSEKVFNLITEKTTLPSEEEIKDVFEKSPELFQQQEQVKIQQIIFRDRKNADDALKEISQGIEFEKIAKKHYAPIEASLPQDFGFIPRGILPESIEKKVFSLQVGDVSPVLESDPEYYIFKILGRKEERPLLWEEARHQIQTMLLQKAKDKQYALWLQEITLKANIKRNYELLQENIHI